MRSVRLDAETERRLTEASRASGMHASEIIRTATRDKCDEILKTSLRDRLAYFIGAVAVDGSNARYSSSDYAKSLLRKHERSRRRGKS
ncbi:MAG: hypothetical protein KIT19_05945 [Phycisphaeraceae bacterium]|nr:hypothetical protein [Phycisphaeraceae bacterium]